MYVQLELPNCYLSTEYYLLTVWVRVFETYKLPNPMLRYNHDVVDRGSFTRKAPFQHPRLRSSSLLRPRRSYPHRLRDHCPRGWPAL